MSHWSIPLLKQGNEKILAHLIEQALTHKAFFSQSYSCLETVNEA